MENRQKLNRWTTGYLIYFALLLTLNYFVKFSVDLRLLMIIPLISYFGIFLVKTHKKAAIRTVLVLIAVVLLIYGVDFLITTYAQYQSRDVLIQDGSKTPDRSESIGLVAKRHDVTFIHYLRDSVDYTKVYEYGKWLGVERIYKQLYSGEEIETNAKYEGYTFLWTSILIAVIILLIFETKWLKFLLAMPLFLYVWLWYMFIDMPWHITALYFAGIVAFFIMDHQEKLLKDHKAYDTTYYKVDKVMLGSLGIAGVVILLSGLLMVAFPIKQVNYVVDLLTPNLWGARSGYENDRLKMYTLRETAFQTSGEILGGPVGPINIEDPIFWVSLDKEIEEAVYLRTVVKDYYDGLRWLNNSVIYKNNFKYYLSDDRNIEMLKAGAYEGISGSISVNRKDTKTVTLFTPMGLIQTDLGSDQVYVSTESEAFFKSGAFVKYLNEYTFNATQRDFYFDTDHDYLQLSNMIEPRTFELALSLGEMGQTDYEKMLRLTNFLSQNYTYSLTPPSNRERKDFVSDFLFDTQKGYCTYFASALSVMARINGIPSRYVEGFRVDPNEVRYGDYSKVTERDAHAWTEVYLEDYGWVIFESTPIFSEVADLGSTPTLDEILDEDDVTAQPGETPEERLARIEQLNLDELLAEADGGRGNFSDIDIPKDDEAALVTSNRRSFLYFGLLSLLAILVLLVSRLPILYLRRQTTHGYAIRMLYLLAYLTAEAKGYSRSEPEYVLNKSNFKDSDIQIWMRLLYDQKSRVNMDTIVRGIDTLIEPIKEAKMAYKLKKGKMAYYKFRLLRIKKIIP
ncbi:MAG TPA: hypothetical protein DCS67_01595 [Clostridiales bacterium UBA8960]|nr:hypothetical protein [Clostridiales bacterium UBA8960]